jgi:hypothetical protein
MQRALLLVASLAVLGPCGASLRRTQEVESGALSAAQEYIAAKEKALGIWEAQVRRLDRLAR